MFAFLSICCTLLVVVPEDRAQAALQPGPGFPLIAYDNLTMFGGYLTPEGTVAYCLEWGKYAPTEQSWPTTDGGNAAEYKNWGALETARINYIVSTWGQTQDPVQAAATALAIWSRHPESATPGLPAFSDDHWAIAQAIPNDEQRLQALGMRNWIIAKTNEYVPVEVAPQGELHIDLDPALDDRATLWVSRLPEGATGIVQLSGATFADSGEPTRTTIQNGSAAGMVLHQRDDSLHSLTAEAKGIFSTPPTIGTAVHLWRTAHNAQDVVSPSPPTPGIRFELTQRVERHDLFIEPTVITQVPTATLAAGEYLADTVTFQIAPGSRPWRRLANGEYVPITAQCQAYGPLLTRPVRSETPPKDAPKFGAPVRLQSPRETDPTLTWTTVEIPEPISKPGFYTFVCGIDANDQDDPQASMILPPNYRAWHDYGLTEETQFTPSDIRFFTQLSQSEAAPGDAITDTITPTTPFEHWVQNAGQPVPVVLHGTAYVGEEQPNQSATVPESGWRVHAEHFVTVIPGEPIRTDPIALPFEQGWVTLHWCLREEDQPEATRGLVTEWCDDFGVPDETVHLAWPAVETTAMQQVQTLESARDTALVSGAFPTNPNTGLWLYFELYKAPQPAEHYTPETIETACSAEHLVFSSEQTPIAVQAAGKIVGPETTLTHPGTYFWVETLQWRSTDSENGGTIHRGACGLAAETTIAQPKLVNTGTPKQAGHPLTGLAALSSAIMATASLIAARVGRNERDAIQAGNQPKSRRMQPPNTGRSRRNRTRNAVQ